MAVGSEFRAFVAELLAPVGPVSIRDMFSGAGVFLDGRMFALIVEETLYLKTDAATRLAFLAEGCGPFTYATKAGRRALVNYHALPERLLDEPEELAEWARRALAVAMAAPAKRTGSAPRKAARKAKGPARRR